MFILNGQIYSLPCSIPLMGLDGRMRTGITTLAQAAEVGGVAYAPPIPSAEELAQQAANLKALRIRQIQLARRDWLFNEIDPDGLFIVNEGVALGLPKALATKTWMQNLAMERFQREALVENGSWDDSYLDYSSMPKPYTIEELIVEKGGL